MSQSANTDESTRFDQLLNGDSILVESLKTEDQQRRRRIRIQLIGIFVVVVGLTAGLTLTQTGLAFANESRVSKGWQLLQTQKPAEAEQLFRELINENPDSVNGWNGLGWAQLNQGKSKESLATFKKCLELEPQLPAALNGAGQALFAQRKYREAKQYLLKAAPLANAAWFGLARISLLEEDFAEAEEWSQKVVNISPENGVAKRMLAAAKEKTLPEDLRSFIEPPEPPTPAVAAAHEKFSAGEMRAARDLYQQILEKTPDNYDALNGLGFCLLNLGQTTEAKECFQKCLKNQPNPFGAMNGMARCLKIEGKTAEAIEQWKTMEEKTSGQVNAATFGLAQTYLEMGEFQLATTYFSKLVAFSPQNDDFKAKLRAAEDGLQTRQ